MQRGDLVLDHGGRYNSYNVYLLVARVTKNAGKEDWWVRNLGELRFPEGWSKDFIEQHNFSHDCLKVSPSSISKNKQRFYHTFKEEYFNTDSV